MTAGPEGGQGDEGEEQKMVVAGKSTTETSEEVVLEALDEVVRDDGTVSGKSVVETVEELAAGVLIARSKEEIFTDVNRVVGDETAVDEHRLPGWAPVSVTIAATVVIV